MRIKSKKNLIIVLCFVSCIWDKIDDRNLIVNNKSTESIYTVLGINDTMKSSYLYSEFENKQIYERFRKNKSLINFRPILPNEKKETSERPKNWDKYLTDSKEKKIFLFIIHKDSVEKYGWFKVFEKNIYNKKYKFTVDELNKQNWNVVYD